MVHLTSLPHHLLIAAAAMKTQGFEDLNPQLYVALALLCKGSALVKVANTEVNNDFEAWRGLHGTYDQQQRATANTNGVRTTTDTFRCGGADDRDSRTLGVRREGIRTEIR